MAASEDPRATAFVTLRNLLKERGQSWDEAAQISQEYVQALSGLFSVEESAKRGRRTRGLARELAGRVENLVGSWVTRAETLVGEPISGRTWTLPLGRFDDLRSCASGLVLTLLETGRSVAESLMAILGGQSVLAGPPLVFQPEPNGPAMLCYWPAAQALYRSAVLAAPDWNERRRAYAELSQAELDRGPLAEDRDESGAWFLEALHRFLIRLAHLAYLQWSIAGLLGILEGRNEVGLAWYNYAKDYSRRAYREPVADSDPIALVTTDELAFWEDFLESDPYLDFAGAALRHVLHGASLEVPVVLTLGMSLPVSDEAQPFGFRLVVNHPLVAVTDADSELRAALTRVRQGRRKALRPEDGEYLEAVQRARKDSNLTADQRAPKGFWEEFQKKWNAEKPDAEMTVNYCRVRYQRLAKRLRAVS